MWVHRVAEEAEADKLLDKASNHCWWQFPEQELWLFSMPVSAFFPKSPTLCWSWLHVSDFLPPQDGDVRAGNLGQDQLHTKHWSNRWAPPAAQQGMIWQHSTLPRPACPSSPSICLNLSPKASTTTQCLAKETSLSWAKVCAAFLSTEGLSMISYSPGLPRALKWEKKESGQFL